MDEISVFSTANYNDVGKVTIVGSVAQPGDYDLINEFTLNDLILEAGNLLPSAKYVNVEVARLNDSDDRKIDFFSFEMENNIEVLDSVFRDKKSFKKFKLFDGDFVSVRPSLSRYNYSFVELGGEVLMPGRYVISEGVEKITDVINRAGGVTGFANLDASVFIRNQDQVNISLSRIIKYPKSQQNFHLADGDQIQIGRKTELISIEGEVNNPGSYKYNSGLSYRDYIKLAGGYTNNASAEGSFVVYPNGTSKKINILV